MGWRNQHSPQLVRRALPRAWRVASSGRDLGCSSHTSPQNALRQVQIPAGPGQTYVTLRRQPLPNITQSFESLRGRPCPERPQCPKMPAPWIKSLPPSPSRLRCEKYLSMPASVPLSDHSWFTSDGAQLFSDLNLTFGAERIGIVGPRAMLSNGRAAATGRIGECQRHHCRSVRCGACACPSGTGRGGLRLWLRPRRGGLVIARADRSGTLALRSFCPSTDPVEQIAGSAAKSCGLDCTDLRRARHPAAGRADEQSRPGRTQGADQPSAELGRKCDDCQP